VNDLELTPSDLLSLAIYDKTNSRLTTQCKENDNRAYCQLGGSKDIDATDVYNKTSPQDFVNLKMAAASGTKRNSN